jgi:hypothetical protein
VAGFGNIGYLDFRNLQQVDGTGVDSEWGISPEGMLFAPALRFFTSAAFRRIRNSADFLRNSRYRPRMIAFAPMIHGAQAKRRRSAFLAGCLTAPSRRGASSSTTQPSSLPQPHRQRDKCG